jgi:hypothetical protein
MRLRRGRCRNLNLPIKDWQANKAICIRVEMEERDAQRHDMPQHSCQIFRDAPGPAVWFIRIDDPHETASIRRCEYRIAGESAGSLRRQMRRGKGNVEVDGHTVSEKRERGFHRPAGEESPGGSGLRLQADRCVNDASDDAS